MGTHTRDMAAIPPSSPPRDNRHHHVAVSPDANRPWTVAPNKPGKANAKKGNTSKLRRKIRVLAKQIENSSSPDAPEDMLDGVRECLVSMEPTCGCPIDLPGNKITAASVRIKLLMASIKRACARDRKTQAAILLNAIYTKLKTQHDIISRQPVSDGVTVYRGDPSWGFRQREPTSPSWSPERGDSQSPE